MQTDPAMTEALSVRTDLSFGDGFRFGCGFMAAFLVFWVILLIFIAVLAGIAYLVAPGIARFLVPGL